MARAKRTHPKHRGGDVVTRQGARGSGHEVWDPKNPEDDPLRDLRPEDEEPVDPVSEEYIWPDTSDTDEEDD